MTRYAHSIQIHVLQFCINFYVYNSCIFSTYVFIYMFTILFICLSVCVSVCVTESGRERTSDTDMFSSCVCVLLLGV